MSNEARERGTVARTRTHRTAPSRVHGAAAPAKARHPERRPAGGTDRRRVADAPAAPQRRNAATPLARRSAQQVRRAPALQMTFRAGNPRRRLIMLFVGSALVFVAVVLRVTFLQTAGSQSLVAAGKAQRVSE